MTAETQAASIPTNDSLRVYSTACLSLCRRSVSVSILPIFEKAARRRKCHRCRPWRPFSELLAGCAVRQSWSYLKGERGSGPWPSCLKQPHVCKLVECVWFSSSRAGIHLLAQGTCICCIPFESQSGVNVCPGKEVSSIVFHAAHRQRLRLSSVYDISDQHIGDSQPRWAVSNTIPES